MTGKTNNQNTKTEWRRAVPDKSKRVAYGCKIESKNIIANKTRSRKDFNYKLQMENYRTFSDDSEEEESVIDAYVYPIQERTRARKSHNNAEKRIESYEELAEKVKTMKIRKSKKSKKKTLKAKKVNQEEDVEEEQEESRLSEISKDQIKEAVKEVLKDQNITLTPKRKSRKNRKSIVPAGLTKSAFSRLKKLGLTYTATKTTRQFKGTDIPKAIQQFLDHKTPEGSVIDALGFAAFELTGEFLLNVNEMNEFKFLRENEDAILIGDGDNILVAKLSDKSDDFNVYVLNDDEPETVSGPHKLSKFLKNANIGEAPEQEEEEDMDQE